MAIKKGIPFEINMADGKSYRVEDEFSIALIGKTALIVVGTRCRAFFPSSQSRDKLSEITPLTGE